MNNTSIFALMLKNINLNNNKNEKDVFINKILRNV